MPRNAARALLTEAERRIALLDRLGAAFGKELGRVLADLERQLALLAPVDTRTRQALVGRGLRLRDELRGWLRDADFDGLVERTLSRGLTETLDAVARTAVGRTAFRFSPLGGSLRMEALYRLAADNLLAWADEAATALWRTLAQGVYAARPRRELLEDLADVLTGREAEVQTLYDTATAQFTREAQALTSDGTADEIFAYLGPVDALMRPFCATHIGKVYTRAEIDALDNGQRGMEDVFLHGGGYNCRHLWMRVSKASELADLASTGTRVPEVVEALKDVRPKRSTARKAA